MDKLKIVGGTKLQGTLPISGAKNATLPLMTASLLTSEPLVLSNVPDLADIESLITLLEQHGLKVSQNRDSDYSKTLTLQVPEITTTVAPYELVRKMRASILVLGPILARCGQASVSLPGGCAIGTRPVDAHLEGLRALGAKIDIEDGYIQAKAPKGLRGADFTFPVVSVTGTENVLMAAVLAQGTTILRNAAQEPEVGDLAHCLNAMGARISGIGTSELVIGGVSSLSGATHNVLPDRVETGTYVIAAGITGGDLHLTGTHQSLLPKEIEIWRQVGLEITPTEEGLHVRADNSALNPVDMITEIFPGFATDLQAQTMALLCLARGTSTITETIFENRFMHVPELCRMAADIHVHGSRAEIKGIDHFKGAPVMATDLRASVSLVLAGLAAQGETEVNRIYHLDRGYSHIEAKLSACGAQIWRENEEGKRLVASPALRVVGS